jgi:cellulose biosynthesis protein BcsQ
MSGPLNITVLAKKGGVGKSNVSLLLYEAFRHAGKTVVINDWDTQGTSTKALALVDPRDPREKLPQADIVIWDTPPSLEHTATATAVRNANIALVISSPYLADTWETEEAVQFVRARNPKAVVRVVIHCVPAGGDRTERNGAGSLRSD